MSTRSLPRLLLISYRFPPETYPLAIGLRGVVDGLRSNWSIDVITAAQDAYAPRNVTVQHVPPRTLDYRVLKRMKLGVLADLGTWPDPFLPWVLPAAARVRRLYRAAPPDAILTFMMPYSTGFAGILAKKVTGAPLVFNLDDSPTCLDQNPSFPSPVHYAATRRMEDFYIRSADAVAYVSQKNLERVRERQASADRSKLHLIRYGATSTAPPRARCPGHLPLDPDTFNIVYVGGISGWDGFVIDESVPAAKRLYRQVHDAMKYRLADVDHRPHGPVYLGQAVRDLTERRPEWKDRIRVHFFGRTHPHQPVDRVLQETGIRDIVTMHGPVDHTTARQLQVTADCLFMSLPMRSNGAESSIISSKTYEYLQTDRPILAALPPGENATYLHGKPGVFVTPPDSRSEMAYALEKMVWKWAKEGPDALSVDRSKLQGTLGSGARAQAFERLLSSLVSSRPASKVSEPAGKPEPGSSSATQDDPATTAWH